MEQNVNMSISSTRALPVVDSIVVSSTADLSTSGGQWSDNVSWTWVCSGCGELVLNGFHVCKFQTPRQQTTPHRCPVCEGRGRVLFDPDAPYQRFSTVSDWPCRPCNATGVVWGY